MKYLTILSLVFFLTSCQYTQTKQEGEEAAAEQTAEPTKDLSYQFALEDNAMSHPYEQKELGYAYDALEPYIDKETMEVHYSKHHAGYTSKFNTAAEANNLGDMKLFEIFARISEYPSAVRNNGGGYYNHLLFWQVLSPDGGGQPSGDLGVAIAGKFGSFDAFREKFNTAATTVFGSGWAWLSVSPEGKLFISKTSNQDNPLMDVVAKNGIPILTLDVWEHAYYLKYQNKRGDYVGNFWNVIHWPEVERRYAGAMAAAK